jgi:tetratricopeptide (TPR) repeat protein
LAAAQADIARARSLTNSGKCADALTLWDKIISVVPEYADAYYLSAICIFQLTPPGLVEDDFRARLHAALADMNLALSLDARNGDYFFKRQEIYHELAAHELYRVDQDYWEKLSLADAQAAERFGTTHEYADRTTALRLIDAGQPAAAYDLFNTLPIVPGLTLETDPGLQEGLGESLFDQGFADKALVHFDLAIKAGPGEYKSREKAIVLLSQGKLAQAYNVLDAMSTNGQLCGCSYYIRALIYYQMGQPAQAQADIDTGSQQTWERGGVRSYVLGLLALDQGDQAAGTQLLQEAQASLRRMYGPLLLKQIQNKLDQLGVPRLDPTPYAALAATPMPTPPED